MLRVGYRAVGYAPNDASDVRACTRGKTLLDLLFPYGRGFCFIIVASDDAVALLALLSPCSQAGTNTYPFTEHWDMERFASARFIIAS